MTKIAIAHTEAQNTYIAARRRYQRPCNFYRASKSPFRLETHCLKLISLTYAAFTNEPVSIEEETICKMRLDQPELQNRKIG